MAVPFRKVSKTRKRMRRTHYTVDANGTTKCTNCGAIIRPHRVCPECGFYKGKKVLSKDEVIAIAEDKNAIISKAANISLLTTTDNEYTLTVTAPDGFTKQTYKIFVIREKGNNTLLNSLVVNTGELVEAFNPNTFEYHWIVKRNSVLGTDSVTAVS